MAKRPEKVLMQSDWLFPEGGIWYIYARQMCRPAINFAGHEKDKPGLLLFRTGTLATEYLAMVRWEIGPKFKLKNFVVRHLERHQIKDWLRRHRDKASWVFWPHLTGEISVEHTVLEIDEILAEHPVAA